MTQVIWAVSTRCDPKADIQTVSGTMTSFLDPASGGLTGKMLIDATRKPGFRGAKPEFPAPALARARALLATAMDGMRK
jgi:3-polyprenyl-4-hydroxybenzoate decarboxylase